MMLLPALVLALATGFCLYTYLGYPAILKLLSLRKRLAERRPSPSMLPRVSIVLPVYNEAAVIAETLEHILAIDYPADKIGLGYGAFMSVDLALMTQVLPVREPGDEAVGKDLGILTTAINIPQILAPVLAAWDLTKVFPTFPASTTPSTGARRSWARSATQASVWHPRAMSASRTLRSP